MNIYVAQIRKHLDNLVNVFIYRIDNKFEIIRVRDYQILVEMEVLIQKHWISRKITDDECDDLANEVQALRDIMDSL